MCDGSPLTGKAYVSDGAREEAHHKWYGKAKNEKRLPLSKYIKRRMRTCISLVALATLPLHGTSFMLPATPSFMSNTRCIGQGREREGGGSYVYLRSSDAADAITLNQSTLTPPGFGFDASAERIMDLTGGTGNV